MDKESTIDMEFIDRDLSDTAATRRSFRVPVDQKENLSVIMKGKTYRAIDINPGGFCVLNKDKIDFDAAQLIAGSEPMIEGCEPVGPDIAIKNLTARIVHISSLHDKGWGNGIQWVNLNGDAKTKIEFQI